MLKKTLSFKILISVAVTITLTIGLCTFVVIRLQTKEWLQRTKESNLFISRLIYHQLEQAMLTSRQQDVQDLLIHIGQSEDIVKANIFDEQGRIVYSAEPAEIGRQIEKQDRVILEKEEKIGLEGKNGLKTFCIITPILNKQNCQGCHGAERRELGALNLGISLTTARKELAVNRNLMLGFAFITLLMVSLVIWSLTGRLINRPLQKIVRTMGQVQAGDLGVKVNINTQDELGSLSNSFNSMITGLQEAKRQLQDQHQERMRQAEKLATVGELASSVAHEIKNPLTGIGAAVQILKDELSLDPVQKDIMDEIIKQVNRLNKTIKDFLQFARPGSPHFMKCRIEEILKKSILLVRNQAEKQGIAIKEDYASDLEPVSVDPEQIQQVFVNITMNALQAMPEGGTLSIQTSKEAAPDKEGSAQIKFADTGPGIDEDDLKKIFKPFFTTRHRGTGLGLSITRNIVENHGGRITCQSRPGQGTAFIIRIPIKRYV